MVLEFYKNKKNANILHPIPDDRWPVPDDFSVDFPIINWYEMYPNGLVLINGREAKLIKDRLIIV